MWLIPLIHTYILENRRKCYLHTYVYTWKHIKHLIVCCVNVRTNVNTYVFNNQTLCRFCCQICTYECTCVRYVFWKSKIFVCAKESAWEVSKILVFFYQEITSKILTSQNSLCLLRPILSILYNFSDYETN